MQILVRYIDNSWLIEVLMSIMFDCVCHSQDEIEMETYGDQLCFYVLKSQSEAMDLLFILLLNMSVVHLTHAHLFDVLCNIGKHTTCLYLHTVPYKAYCIV